MSNERMTIYSVTFAVWGSNHTPTYYFDNLADAKEFYMEIKYADPVRVHNFKNKEKALALLEATELERAWHRLEWY